MPPYEAFLTPIKDPMSQTAIVGVLLFILLDFLLGIGGAVMTSTFSSEKMRAGLLHKYTELCAVAMGVILDGILAGGLELEFQPVLLATCAYVILMEVGSVLELVKKYNPDAEGLVGWLTSRVMPKGGDING